MPLFNFQKRFADAVESGEKRQTIRAKRKNRPKIGQTAFLYTGCRTKACRKLGEHEITNVQDIYISEHEVLLECYSSPTPMEISQLIKIAADDGFMNWHEMRDWFAKNHGLPFEGDLIKW